MNTQIMAIILVIAISLIFLGIFIFKNRLAYFIKGTKWKKLLAIGTGIGIAATGMIFLPPDTPPEGDDGEGTFWIFPELEPYQISVARQFNWSKFWEIFKNHALWSLEAYHPGLQEWVDANSLLTIHRNYTQDNSCKIGLEFTTPDNDISTDWRLTLAIDTRVKNYVNRSGDHEYTLRFEKDGYPYNVSFNWSDMLQYSGLIFNHGIKNIAGDDYFWFRVRRNNIPPNFFVDLDPQYTIESSAGDMRIGFTNMRAMGRQSNGTLWVTYNEYDIDEQYVAYSEDYGETWTEHLIYNGAADSPYGCLCVDSNDTVHVFYPEDVGSTYDLMHVDSTDWFDTKTQVNDDEDYDYYQACAVDSNDNLHLVCEQSSEGASNDDQVAYFRSKDNGLTWSNENILTNEPDVSDDLWYPTIAIDGNDTIHVGYIVEDYRNGVFDDCFHMYSTDCGDTWSGWLDDIINNPDTQYFSYPCFAVDDNDVLHCSARDQISTNDLQYTKNVSSSWEDKEVVETHGYWGSIVIDSNETCYIAGIADGETGGYDINGTYGNWGTWTYIVFGGNRASALHSYYPIIDGVKTNRPKSGYCAVFADYDGGLYYYADSNLDWDEPEAEEPPVTPQKTVGIQNTGIDYFVWLGESTNAWNVSQQIDNIDEHDEYIAIWNNDTWADDNATWQHYHPDNQTGTNFTIETFDIIKIYLTDSGTQNIEMYENTSADYDSSRTLTLANSSTNKGYNFSAQNNAVGTTLSAINTSVGLEAGEGVAVWNNTTYAWVWYISGIDITDDNVERWDVIQTKVEDTETWNT